MNDAIKYFLYKFGTPRGRWYPFISVFYLTYACDFRCFYCSDGTGKPYHELPTADSSPEIVMRIVRAIRTHVNHIVITGGEPALYDDLPSVCAVIKELSFKTSVFTTNGYHLHRAIDVLSSTFTDLVISLDSLDKDSANRNYRCGGDRFTTIVDNILHAKTYMSRSFDITISSVVCAKTVRGLFDVFEFSQSHGFMFAAAPRLIGVVPEHGLSENDDYRAFYNHLINEKKRGRRVFGSTRYLEYMRDLKKFTCKPLTMLVVGPDGGVFYPCLEIGNRAGNIIENDFLHEMRKRSERIYGSLPECGNQCHSACALGFGLGI